MSNKTLLEPAKKTASAPRKYILIAAGAVGLALIMFGLAFFLTGKTYQFGSQTVSYTRLTNSEARQQGLSGRASLPTNQAMLFVFEEPGNHCFWMKDMRFPIDIVWLDQDKKVISTKENVAPSTYPESFCPTDATKYVIEVNAGTVRNAGVDNGQRLQF